MSGNVKVEFSPIGVVKREPSDDEEREVGRKSPTVIQVFPEFQEALEGLGGFSHIFVLSYLDRLRPEQKNHLKIRPRRSLLLKTGLRIEEIPLVGVFAIDTPGRPNPIGLTLVKLLGIEGRELSVLGLDLFNGTPILDIKPYRDDYRTTEYKLADWYKKLRDIAGEEV